jgi:hypothetical protein
VSVPSHRHVDLCDHFPGTTIDPQDAEAVAVAFHHAGIALALQGGGVLDIPPGEWLVQPMPESPKAAVWMRTRGTTLRGAGMRATRLRLVGGQPSCVVCIVAPGVTVERLTIVGNLDDAPQDVPPALAERGLTADDLVALSIQPHGVVAHDCPAFTQLRDLVIEDVVEYATNFSVHVRTFDHPGDCFCDIVLRNVHIRRCGNDAIDFKMRPTPGAVPGREPAGSSGPRAFLRNVSVVGHSSLWPGDEPGDRRGENGVDARGQVHLQNIEVREVRPGRYGKGGGSGICLRDETASGDGVSFGMHGAGGQWSTLSGYFISRLPADEAEPHGRGGGVLTTPLLATTVQVANGHVVDLQPPEQSTP